MEPSKPFFESEIHWIQNLTPCCPLLPKTAFSLIIFLRPANPSPLHAICHPPAAREGMSFRPMGRSPASQSVAVPHVPGHATAHRNREDPDALMRSAGYTPPQPPPSDNSRCPAWPGRHSFFLFFSPRRTREEMKGGKFSLESIQCNGQIFSSAKLPKSLIFNPFVNLEMAYHTTCAHVCMYVFENVCMYVSMYVCLSFCLYVWYVSMPVCPSICLHVRLCRYICMYA